MWHCHLNLYIGNHMDSKCNLHCTGSFPAPPPHKSTPPPTQSGRHTSNSQAAEFATGTPSSPSGSLMSPCINITHEFPQLIYIMQNSMHNYDIVIFIHVLRRSSHPAWWSHMQIKQSYTSMPVYLFFMTPKVAIGCTCHPGMINQLLSFIKSVHLISTTLLHQSKAWSSRYSFGWIMFC